MTATERALNDTMEHVKALNASDSYRVLGRRFNVPFSTLRDIACGRFEHVSWDTLLLVRMRLGMPDLPTMHTVDGCPTCGGVHIAGDCHGREVLAVVTLAPGEVVTRASGDGNPADILAMVDRWIHEDAEAPMADKPKRERKRYIRPCLSPDPAQRRVQLLKLLEECE